MGSLQQMCDEVVKAKFTDEYVAGEVLRHILERKGVKLTEAQRKYAARKLLRAADNESCILVTFDTPGPDVSIELTEDDFKRAIEDFARDTAVLHSSLISGAVKSAVPLLRNAVRRSSPKELSSYRNAVREFRAGLQEQWHAVLDLLDTMILVAQQSRNEFTCELDPEDVAEVLQADALEVTDEEVAAELPPEAYLWEAVVGLHVRACRTAKEISVLLAAGYADGANARWRSLHELAVVAMFLVERRKDLAERYLGHAVVQEYFRAQEYQRAHVAIGGSPIETTELDSLRRARDAAIQKYGAGFESDYGWAAEELRKTRPTFAELEASLDMKQWRVYYKLACDDVHASSRTLYYRDTEGHDCVVDDALNCGLSGPAQSTAKSLAMVTAALMTIEPNVDSIAMCEVMRLLDDELQDAADQAEEAVGNIDGHSRTEDESRDIGGD
ncbi:MAG: DUF5677 domain-containing protein [Phycisphaerae bacterium]|jgi:hypothetical protein